MAHREVAPAGPVTTWSGWDVRGKAAADAAEAFAPASRRASGPEEAYELLAVAARGFRPPRFLRTADRTGVGRTTIRERNVARGSG